MQLSEKNAETVGWSNLLLIDFPLFFTTFFLVALCPAVSRFVIAYLIASLATTGKSLSAAEGYRIRMRGKFPGHTDGCAKQLTSPETFSIMVHRSALHSTARFVPMV